MLEEVKKTDASFLLGKIKGLSDIMVASFAGVVGRVGNYRFGKEIFSKSGLSSKVNQSGERNIKGLSIRRVGSKVLRCILFKMAHLVERHNPYFSLYYSYLTKEKGSFGKKSILLPPKLIILSKGNNVPKKVSIIEVGPRDGLQNLKFYIETSEKVSLINALSKTGLERIEITSFVHPKAVPQFKDASEVVKGIEKEPGVRYYVLVPNLMGAVRAFKSGAKNLNFVISASETHNKRNVNRTIGESLEEFRLISKAAKKENGGNILKASLATAYGCPFEEEISSNKVIDIVAQLQELGATEIALCDTAGMASPVQIASLISTVQKELSDIEISVHFHAEKERGLVNILAAVEAGVTLFESSISGLGGCPFLPGAVGNIPTEDMISMFEERGISTGVDLRKFASCRTLIQAIMKN